MITCLAAVAAAVNGFVCLLMSGAHSRRGLRSRIVEARRSAQLARLRLRHNTSHLRGMVCARSSLTTGCHYGCLLAATSC